MQDVIGDGGGCLTGLLSQLENTAAATNEEHDEQAAAGGDAGCHRQCLPDWAFVAIRESRIALWWTRAVPVSPARGSNHDGGRFPPSLSAKRRRHQRRTPRTVKTQAGDLMLYVSHV